MFELIHGPAFDIMGKGLPNPLGTFWSVVMLLDHLGEAEAARRVMQAIEHVTADSKLHTRDLGGTATTADVTRAVCAEIVATKNTQLAASTVPYLAGDKPCRSSSNSSAVADCCWTSSRVSQRLGYPSAIPIGRPIAVSRAVHKFDGHGATGILRLNEMPRCNPRANVIWITR